MFDNKVPGLGVGMLGTASTQYCYLSSAEALLLHCGAFIPPAPDKVSVDVQEEPPIAT